jgi:hypothetical protein
MDNGTLVQINTKTEQATKNRVSKVWLSDDLKMKALEDKLIQAPHKNDIRCAAGKKLRLLF